MNCKHVQHYLDSFLIDNSEGELKSDIAEHIANCPRCARDYEAAVQAMQTIRLTKNIRISHELKDNIMRRISESDVTAQNTGRPKRSVFRLWKPIVITGANHLSDIAHVTRPHVFKQVQIFAVFDVIPNRPISPDELHITLLPLA